MTDTKKKLLHYKDFKTDSEIFGPKPSLFDLNKIKKDKIELERRRRHQIYTFLECMFKNTSYFDFFSIDAFRLAIDALSTAQILKKKEVTSEMLVFPFLLLRKELTEILAESNITERNVGEYYVKKNKVHIPTWFERIKDSLKFLIATPDCDIENDVAPDPTISFSYEVNYLFEKAAKNTFQRFRTLVITPELLFVTIMEEKQTKGGKMINNLIGNETDFYLLRYKILKRFYYEEIATRNQISQNQIYFGYLLKTQLTGDQYADAIDLQALTTITAYFRDLLVTKGMNFDMSDFLIKDVTKTMSSLRSKRTTYNLGCPVKIESELMIETEN